MTSTHHEVTARDGRRLHVVEVGPTHRPAVLLLHGVGSSSSVPVRGLRRSAARRGVAPAGRRPAGPRPVRPRTAPCPTMPSTTTSADVEVLARRFAPAVVGGVSLGGHAAVGAAAAGVPCDAVLACLPAWSGRSVPGEGPHAAVAAEVAAAGIDGMLARFRADTTMVPWLREVLAARLGRPRPGLAGGGPHRAGRRAGPDRRRGRGPARAPGRRRLAGRPGPPARGRRGLGRDRAPRGAGHHHPRRDAGRPHRLGQAAVTALAELGITRPP